MKYSVCIQEGGYRRKDTGRRNEERECRVVEICKPKKFNAQSALSTCLEDKVGSMNKRQYRSEYKGGRRSRE